MAWSQAARQAAKRARGGKRKMTSGEARQSFDRMYEDEARRRQAKSEAYLKTPQGEAERQKHNAETMTRLKAKKK